MESYSYTVAKLVENLRRFRDSKRLLCTVFYSGGATVQFRFGPRDPGGNLRFLEFPASLGFEELAARMLLLTDKH